MEGNLFSHLSSLKPNQKGAKIDYDYQQLGLELKVFFGKNLWWVFWKPYAIEWKVRRAFAMAQKENDKDVSHFIKNIQQS